ncbi:hypothetical protein ACVW19_006873 [Streptomyces sp. TE5632]
MLVWDDYTHHLDAAMRALVAARAWLTVFRFPSYAPDLNPAEGVWAHLKRSLGNLAPCSIDELAALARTRLKRMQYQAGLLDGFITGTGLALTRRNRHPEPKRSLAGPARGSSPPTRGSSTPHRGDDRVLDGGQHVERAATGGQPLKLQERFPGSAVSPRS